MNLIDYMTSAVRYDEASKVMDEAESEFRGMQAKVAKVYSDLTGDQIDDEDPRYYSIVQEMLEVAKAFDLQAATDALIRNGYGDDKECRELAKKIRRRIQK